MVLEDSQECVRTFFKKDKLNSSLICLFLTIRAINKDIKARENFANNHFNNILRLFHALRNFLFNSIELMCDY